MSHGSLPGKSRERERFGFYLRRGVAFPEAEAERKFNPYHDPDDGRFTFAPGGGTLPPGSHIPRPAAMTGKLHREAAAAGASYRGPMRNPMPQPKQPPARSVTHANHGALSAKYESGNNGDPGSVSSGANDPGGVSYGKHQYSSKTGSAARFVASPEASKWAKDFRGLTPGSPQFDAKWRQIAARDRASFGTAQDAFSGRVYYQATVGAVARSTGLDIDQRSEAVRQATYSVAIQHGGAAAILRDAVRTADRQMNRTDQAYETALINAIYDQRIEYVIRLRNRAITDKRLQDARGFDNILKNRYPHERADALRLLRVAQR